MCNGAAVSSIRCGGSAPGLRGLGHALPLGLGALAFAVGVAVDTGSALMPTSEYLAVMLTALLGGAPAALFGGFFWKMTLITRACHQQGFALPRMPQRGSGSRAAPTLSKPVPRADAAAAMQGAAAE